MRAQVVFGFFLPIFLIFLNESFADRDLLVDNASLADVEDALQDTLDLLIQDLEDKYSLIDPNDFWHPYVYGTGNENREVLHVKNVEKGAVGGDYIQWKYARLGLKHYLIGLKRRQIDILGSDFRTVFSFPTQDDMEALTVFTKWNMEANRPEMVILTVSAEPRLYLHTFEDNVIKTIAGFPLHYSVKTIEFCHAGQSSKVVLIPKDPTMDIDIYNVEIHNSTQVWFFQRITAKEKASVVVYDSDLLESVIAISASNLLFVHTYDVKEGLFVVSQNVELPNPCQSLFSFTVAYQHYIGCVPVDPNFSVRFVSFNYNKNEYVLEDEDSSFKSMPIISVHPIAVPDYTDQYFTLTQDVLGVTRILVYHGRQSGFQVEYNCSENTCPDVSDLSKGVGFRFEDSSAFIFPSGENGRSMYWLITKQINDSSSPLVDESRLLYNSYIDLSKRFDEWERNVLNIEKALNNSIKPDKPNVIEGKWDVNKISASDLVFLEGKNSPKTVFNELKFIGSEWTEEDFATNMKQIGSELNTLKKNANFATGELDKAIFVDNEFVQRVTAPQKVTGRFNTLHLRSTKMTTKTLGDNIEIKPFLNSFVSKSSDIRVKGELVFENTVTVVQLNTTKINTIPINNIARYSQDNSFECSVQFNKGLTASENVVTPTINGVKLAEELMLVSNISGINFVDGFVIGNNTNFKGEFSFDNVLLKSSSQVVESSIHFQELSITGPVNVTNIDGVNFNSFVSSVVTSNYSGLIKGRKTVHESIQTKLLNIDSNWNGVPFPNGFVRNKQNRVVLDASTTFETITTNKATVEGRLDGALLDDLVTRNSSQDIKVSWTFLGPVTIVKDIAVAGLVDGVDMKELGNKGTLNDFRDVHAFADVEFEQDVVIDSLHVKKNINGQSFQDIFNNILFFNGSTCEIPGETTLLTNLTLDSLTVDSGVINEQPLESFFLISGDQNITGDLTFSKDITWNSLNVLKKYDDVDLRTLLNQAVRLTIPNKIMWEASFDHIKCEDGITIEGPVNGISDFGNNVAVVSGRPSQKFTSPITFEKVFFNSIVVENDLKMNEAQKLGGLVIEDWYSRRLSTSKPENIVERFEIDGIVKTSFDIVTQLVNNVSLKVLAENALRSDALEQGFTSHVTFQQGLDVKDGKILFEDTISGFDLNEISHNAFPLNSNENEGLLLTGIWNFESIKVDGNLNVNGLTCGVDLTFLGTDLVQKDQQVIKIDGNKNFSNITAENGVNTTTLNFKNTADLFTLNSNQTITCPFKTTKDIKVNKNLETEGRINGGSNDILSKKYSLKNNNTHVIHSDYVFNHNITSEKLTVKGTIQGQNFADATTNAQRFIKVDDKGLKFTGTKTFTTQAIIQKDSTAKVYNDLQIEDVKFLQLNEDHVFDTQVAFQSIVNAPTVELNSNDLTVTFINDLNWEELLRESIPLGQEVDKEDLKFLTFDNIIVDKNLTTKVFQGHEFSDFILLEGGQNIEFLNVRKLKITGTKLNVQGMFNGHDLQEELAQTVMKTDLKDDDVFQLNGKKSFNGTLTVEGDVQCFGPTFKDNVVDITKPFKITTPLQFLQPVFIENGLNVSGTVQGFTVEDILTDALTKNQDQSITGKWEFSKGVTFKDVVYGPGKLKNFDVQSLVKNTEVQLRAAGEKIQSQKQKYVQECQNVRNATNDILFNPMKLDAFDKHQTIALKTQVDKIVVIEASEKLVLLTSGPSCEIVRYEWNNYTELFYKNAEGYGVPKLGRIKDWQSSPLGLEALLVFSTGIDDCLSLPQGLHFTVMHSSGKFSGVKTLLYGEIKNFRLISDIREENWAIFALSQDNILHGFTWNEYTSKFERIDTNIGATFDKIDATNYHFSVGILLTSPIEIAVLQFSWKNKTIAALTIQPFLTSNATSPTVFDSYGTLITLIPEKQAQITETLPFSITQVFNLVDRKLVKLQQLPFSDTLHRAVINFSNQIFISFLSKTYGLNIYKFKGLSGLERLNENPIKIFNGIGITVFDVEAWRYSAPRPFIAVLTANTVEIYHSNVYGDSLDQSSKSICRV